MLISFIKVWWLIMSGYFNADQPQFKGGSAALNSFIASKMIYPTFSKSNCLQGTIMVSFKLDKSGRVVESTVEKGMGIDLDAEALRLIRLTNGKWEIPNDYDDNSKLLIPIKFELKNYNCTERSKDDLKNAITAYQNNLAMQNVVTSYYKNKLAGKVDLGDESEILALKSQLGFDEKFIAEKLRNAKQKLKQGDQQGACESLYFVKYIGSGAADAMIEAYCK